MRALGGSVGERGRNLASDVSAVQRALHVAGIDVGAVDGKCGPKTIGGIRRYQQSIGAALTGLIGPADDAWRQLSDAAGAVTWDGDSSQWPQEKKLLSMEPRFREKVRKVVTALQQQGFQPKIVFGWRSVKVQAQLVAEGKSKVHFSFHNAQLPDGTPNAYAADVVDVRWAWNDEAETNGFWQALGDCAKANGLVWGGDWQGFRDVAHIQGRQNSELADVKRESGL